MGIEIAKKKKNYMQKSPIRAYDVILKPGGWEIGDFTINFWWNINDPIFFKVNFFFQPHTSKISGKKLNQMKKIFLTPFDPILTTKKPDFRKLGKK